MNPKDQRPLIAHVIHHLSIGGLENGVVNLINNLPKDRYRHCIVCMTDADSFRDRLRDPDVQVYQIHKRPSGNDLSALWRVFKLFRRIKPSIVHSRNLTALEAQVPAWLCGISIRIHGEHGRDINDLDGSNKKLQWIRRIYSPFVHHYVALSRDLYDYLLAKIGVSAARVTQIYNGVDQNKFHPQQAHETAASLPFAPNSAVVFGTVGRLQPVKGQLDLLKAFILVRQQLRVDEPPIKLVLVGDGATAASLKAFSNENALDQDVYFAGAQNNVVSYLHALDVFVLPSLAEGISNTLLEAMASGLPVLATAVGGNPELVSDGQTGVLVPAGNPQALADAMLNYARNPALRAAHGQAGVQRVDQKFSLKAMLASYGGLYDRWLERRFGKAIK